MDKKPKLIAKGAFTKCYLLPGGEKVRLESSDPSKECISLGWGADHSMFPEMKRVDDYTYEMKYYPRVTSLKSALDPDQWEFYKKLKEINEKTTWTRSGKDWEYLDSLRAEFAELPDGEALNEHLDGLLNYGSDIGFEISPRNVAADNGKLILLDCFFFRNKLNEVRAAKKKTNKY